MANYQQYMDDIRNYVDDPDEAQVNALAGDFFIAMQDPDSSVVNCAQDSELERVRESFLKKKLDLNYDDKKLDDAIRDVCETMSAKGAEKNRVTFYYLLLEKFDAKLQN